MSQDCRRKTELEEEAHTDTGRTYTTQKGSGLPAGLNVLAVLITVSLCCHSQHQFSVILLPRFMQRKTVLNIGTRVTLETVIYERAHAGSNKWSGIVRRLSERLALLLRPNSLWTIENEPMFTCLWVIYITQTEANTW